MTQPHANAHSPRPRSIHLPSPTTLPLPHNLRSGRNKQLARLTLLVRCARAGRRLRRGERFGCKEWSERGKEKETGCVRELFEGVGVLERGGEEDCEYSYAS